MKFAEQNFKFSFLTKKLYPWDFEFSVQGMQGMQGIKLAQMTREGRNLSSLAFEMAAFWCIIQIATNVNGNGECQTDFSFFL
jgi:hypothetical protein